MIRLALIITSDSVYRGEKRDEITGLVEEKVKGLFHIVASRVVPNSISEIRATVLEAVREADIVLVTGGTGVSRRDITIEALKPIASKTVPGLGEEHRRRSYAKIGARALLSRTEAFIIGNTLVYACPGNPDAVSTALDILTEIGDHCIAEIRGEGHRERH
ncbi:MAG: molybdopterin-binding protein [Acidilobaceae archaeon]